jgi:hypothetical protein
MVHSHNSGSTVPLCGNALDTQAGVGRNCQDCETLVRVICKKEYFDHVAAASAGTTEHARYHAGGTGICLLT